MAELTNRDKIIRQYLVDSLHIINTPLEEPYERITRLVCRVMDVAACGIGIISEDQIWFKSLRGIETPEKLLEQSFCNITVKKNDILEITDAKHDERFKSLPSVQSGSVTYYAGYPLSLGGGVNIGALAVYDSDLKIMVDEDLQVLKDFAQTVSIELNKRLQLNFTGNESALRMMS